MKTWKLIALVLVAWAASTAGYAAAVIRMSRFYGIVSLAVDRAKCAPGEVCTYRDQADGKYKLHKADNTVVELGVGGTGDWTLGTGTADSASTLLQIGSSAKGALVASSTNIPFGAPGIGMASPSGTQALAALDSGVGVIGSFTVNGAAALTNSNGAVSSANLAAGAVVEAKLGTGAVTATKLGTGAVTATKLGTGAVTATKLGSMVCNGTIVGANGAGTRAVTLEYPYTDGVSGARVVKVIGTVDFSTPFSNLSADFGTTLSGTNQIQQTGGNYAAYAYIEVLYLCDF